MIKVAKITAIYSKLCILFLEEGQVRLTNGDNGLLEVYFDGEWGYVCDDGWIEANGDVVCGILGYEGALSSSIYHYASDVNYRLNFINCAGGEETLLNCSYGIYTPNYCGTYEHIYISCRPGKLYNYNMYYVAFGM